VLWLLVLLEKLRKFLDTAYGRTEQGILFGVRRKRNGNYHMLALPTSLMLSEPIIIKTYLEIINWIDRLAMPPESKIYERPELYSNLAFLMMGSISRSAFRFRKGAYIR